MAGPQPAPSRAGQYPHDDWIPSLLQMPGRAMHPTGAAVAGSSQTATQGTRRAPPFGGHLVSASASPAAAGSRIMEAFGGAPQMTPSEEAELRLRQTIQGQAARQADIQNSWAAIPALAPVATVLSLEAAGPIVGDLARPRWPENPLHFPWRELSGETKYTRLGRYVHSLYRAAAEQKAGWDAEKPLATKGGTIRPDLQTPLRGPIDEARRFLIETKPNTPSGRRAAALAVKRYFELKGQKTRAIFYNPEDYE